MTRRRISIFLLIITGLLVLCNWVVYESLSLAFGITQGMQLVLLGTALGILSASFIASTIIGNWYYNILTRVSYSLSAIWMGIFLYLFLASIIFALLAFASLQATGPYIYVGTLLLSLYGIWNARRIVITQVNVALPRLPPSWNNRKAVWMSDIHLGQLHGASFAAKVVQRVMSVSPDIIFVGGDLYDGGGARDIQELSSPLTGLHAPLGVFFVTGNHEEYGNRAGFIAAVQSAGMRVLDDEKVEIDGVQIVGVDYQHAEKKENFAAILSRLTLNSSQPSILLKHEPKDLDVAEAAGISLQISGHTHKAQMWPLVYIAQRTYQGFAYGLKRLKNMQVYTSSGVGTWGPPLRVGSKSEIVLITFH